MKTRNIISRMSFFFAIIFIFTSVIIPVSASGAESGIDAPGGEEITMALLIVSGLLAVASFIAFLISLSSIRKSSNKKEKDE